jgi:plastocyanin
MKRLLSTLGLLGATLLLAACSASGGGAATPAASAAADAIPLSSKDLQFSTSELVAPAGKPFQIAYDNQEGAPHNVAIYQSEGGAELFKGEVITGPKQIVYNVPAQAAGTYYFQCDVHPNMKGSVTVE